MATAFQSGAFQDSGFQIDAASGTNYSLTCTHGTYALTGQAATFTQASSLTCAVGSYTFSGQNATFVWNHKLTAAQGSYSFTGQNASVVWNHRLTASNGSYSFTGYDATLAYAPGSSKVDYSLSCSHGSYSLTGQAITVAWNHKLTAANGSYTFVGKDVSFNRGYSLSCANGSYTYTGQVSTFTLGKKLIASNGSYSLTGQDASLALTKSLDVSSGTYSFTGQDATLAFSGGNVEYSLTCSHGSYNLTNGYAVDGYVTEGYWQDNVELLYKSKAGSSASSPNRSRRVYIERDGQILVFAKPALAAAYIEAEKAQSVVETTTKLPKRLKPKTKVVQPEAVIEIDVLSILVEKYQLPDVNQYIKNHDYEAILNLYLQAQIMQEEEDIEILLLAA